ncbi:MAG: hypothetical protein IKQ36_11000 [Clostridia bacterium]|nr:hypothetical protein [Clostridia bacterium]
MKKLLCTVLAVMIMLVSVSTAFADGPTNPAVFNYAAVHGGNSQEICQKSCTYVQKCVADITAVWLGNQSHISFRPYWNGHKLLVYPQTVNCGALYNIFYDHNTDYVKVGRTIVMKASIPSSNTAVESYFSGTIYF